MDTRTKIEIAIDHCRITPERFEEMWQTKGPFCELHPTPEEDRQITDIWDEMDGNSAWISAFFAAWHRKLYLKSLGIN